MAIKIAVSSGHGMETAGKRTPPLIEDLYINGKLVRKKGEVIHEKEFNKGSAEYLIKALKRCGFEVLNVSEGTKDIPLSTRVNKANKWGADFYISKHYNALGDCKYFQGKARGIVSIYNSGSTKGSNAAKLIQAELIKEHGGYNFGARADKDISGFSLYELSKTKMVAVLTESGFMDNIKEANRMLDPTFQKADGEATCRGICKYFNVKYIEENEVIEEIKDIPKYIKIIQNVNRRSEPNFSNDKNIVRELKVGEVFTVVARVKSNCSTDMYKLKSGVYVTTSKKYVEEYKK